MSADTGPLPSGAAAGVKQAQGKDDDDTPIALAGRCWRCHWVGHSDLVQQ